MRISKLMDYRIFYGVIALLMISTGTAFAQVSVISIQTNDSNYDEGDTIVVSGTIKTIIGETPVIVRLFTGGNLVGVEQITVSQEGTFAKGFLAEGALWKKSGEYIAIVSYNNYKVETKFNYTPKSGPIETTENFEVSAGVETFDVEYTIKGGTIKDIVVDEDMFAVIVHLESTDEGTITLDLPKELIRAEKQDGKDETFIILINGIQVAYQEPIVHSESRVITINFEGDSVIEIIGTWIVPEFGTIVMLILIIGIMTIVVVSRNKFQIKV